MPGARQDLRIKIILLLVILVISFWVFDSIWDLLPSAVGSEIYKRLFISLLIIVFVLVISRFVAGRKQVEGETEKSQEDISTLKQADESDKDSFKNLFENAVLGIYRTTPDGRILMANRRMVQMLGYSSFEELAKRNLEKGGFWPTYPRSHFKEMLERNGEIRGLEAAWIKDDGTPIFVRENARVVRGKDGSVLYYEGTVEDITEKKLAEKALKESEEKYRFLYERAPAVNLIIGIDGTIKDINESFIEKLGYSRNEVIGKDVLDFVVPEHLEKVMKQLEQSFQGEDTSEIEVDVYAKDGSVHTLLFSPGQVVLREEEKPISILVTGLDITERRRTELALRESEERYRSIFENASDAIFVESLRGDILEVNEKACELLGYKKEELLSLTVKDLLPAGEEGKLSEIADALKENRSLIIEGKNRCKDGSIVDVEVSIRPITWKGQDAYLVFVRDVSERKKIENYKVKKTEQALRFHSALLELAKVEFPELSEALKIITETDAKTMGVERVSVWFFNEDRTEILCEDLYKLSKDEHEKGLRLQTKEYPRYFNAIENSRIIVANDARKDAQTNEYAESYLKTFGITSMMDVPIRLHGKIVGILCHEHVGRKREWTPEEQSFGISIADMISLVLEDIEREKAIKALRESEEKYRAAVEQSADNIYIMDLETKTIVETNPTLQKLLGYSADEMKGLSVYDIVALPPENIDQKIELVLRRKRAFLGERQYRCKDGSVVDVEASASYITYGGKKALCVVSRDITKRKRTEEELKRLAITDPLTEVLNRRAGLTLLKRQLQWANWTSTKFCIGYVDVNNLKEINDTLGHAEGDEVLIATCQLLKDVLRESDLICRLGGDEFLLILPDFTIEQTIGLRERIVEKLAKYNSDHKKSCPLELSLGFAEYDPISKISLEQLLATADREMYLSKYIK